MDINFSQEDKNKLREIYFELRRTLTSINSLDRLNELLNEAIEIAERYGEDVNNELLTNLKKTRETQLRIAINTPERKNKVRAIADLQLFIQGDLLGWF